MAAALLNAANDGDAKDRLLPRIAAGAMIVSVCAADAQGRWLGADPAVSAVRSGAVTPQGEAASTPGWLLTGDSHFVLDAGVATCSWSSQRPRTVPASSRWTPDHPVCTAMTDLRWTRAGRCTGSDSTARRPEG
ncbi:hypothetical protein BJF84_07730 [Rhodococcus sp. CUA-806]|nr:hypothetical protein BJF84_07730 [Rhodococcus sp. CUA-806]